MTKKTVKTNLRRFAKVKGVKLIVLSSISGLGLINLLHVLYFPFSSVKLFQAVRICKALKISLSQVF